MTRPDRPHVALVGLPGVGKTTIVDKLAAELQLDPVDLDEQIVERAGRSIPEIFETDGEARFRELEHDALAAAVAGDHRPSAIACGAGIVLVDGNRRLLRERTRCVWLDADPAVLAARVPAESGRPLLRGDVAGRLAQLSAERRPLYEEVAMLTIDAGHLTEDECVALIVEKLR